MPSLKLGRFDLVSLGLGAVFSKYHLGFREKQKQLWISLRSMPFLRAKAHESQ
jgi:hypothetical protein